MGNTEFRDAARRFNEGEMDRLAAAADLHSWQVELQFYGSERTTLANWEYAQELIARKVPGARFTDGESLKVPLTREQIATTTGPYPTNMRRNITQGVPGLGIWYMTGRTEQNPNAWNETHIGLFSLIGRSGEAVLQAQTGFRGHRAQARDAERVPERDPNARQLVSVRVPDGQRLRPRRRRREPGRQDGGHGEAARGARGERRSSATATTARRRSCRTTSPISTRSTTTCCGASTRR